MKRDQQKLPALPIPPVVGWHYLQIGDYVIGEVPAGYWIEHESGEGMHVSKERMEKLIREFYKENF